MAVSTPVGSLKSWLNIGETLFGSDLNNNFAELKNQYNAHSHTEFVTAGSTGLFGDGTVLLPSIAFQSEPSTGLYVISTNVIGMAVAGVKVLEVASAGLTVTGALVLGGPGNFTAPGTVFGGLRFNAVGGAITSTVGATTGSAFHTLSNDGNSATWGIESLAGTSWGVTGTTAYSLILGTASARSLHLYTSNTARLTIDGSGNLTASGPAASFAGAVTVAGAATIAGTLGVTGVSTLTGDVIASVIRRNTVDGADNESVAIGGGGAAGMGGRGASVFVYGNEAAGSPGNLDLFAGTVGSIGFYISGSEKGRVTNAGVFAWTGAATVGGTLGVTGLAGFSGGVALEAADKLYLDGVAGTGNTYITEVSADQLDFVVGGTVVVRSTATTVFVPVAISVTGVSTLTGDVVASVIRQGTSDGADTSYFVANGGGGVGSSRGAYAQLFGNEVATYGGNFILAGGNVAGGDIVFETAATNRGRVTYGGILAWVGAATIGGTLGVTGNATFNNTIIIDGSGISSGSLSFRDAGVTKGVIGRHQAIIGSGVDDSLTILSETGLGIAFMVNGSPGEVGRITNGGILAWGTTVVTGASAGEIVIQNTTRLRSVIAAGTATIPLIGSSSGNVVQVGDAASSIFTSLGRIAAASLPAFAAGFEGVITVDSTNNRLVFYTNGDRRYVTGVVF